MGVADSFSLLLRRIQPDQTTVQSADRRLGEVRTCLANSSGLNTLMKVGSFSRGSFIRGASDIDGFAVLSRASVRWGEGYKSSDTVLNGLRERLSARYPRTRVLRDGPAIVVRFADCDVDVVPAIYWEPRHDGWPIYAMPDGAGNWFMTSPGRHNAYIRKKNIRAGGKLLRTAQLLKLWRSTREPRVPISSFHIEMLLAAEGVCEGAKSYGECVADAFGLLARRSCRALQDPEKISGLIAAARTEAQARSALATVRHSSLHAELALDAEAQRDTHEARRQWKLVFNGLFPGASA